MLGERLYGSCREVLMNRTVIIATVAAAVIAIAVGYFVLSSVGIVSNPGGGTMNTPQR